MARYNDRGAGHGKTRAIATSIACALLALSCAVDAKPKPQDTAESGQAQRKSTCLRYRDTDLLRNTVRWGVWKCRDGDLLVTEYQRSPDVNRCWQLAEQVVRGFVSAGMNPREDRLRINVACQEMEREKSITEKITDKPGPVWFALRYDPESDDLAWCDGKFFVGNGISERLMTPEDWRQHRRTAHLPAFLLRVESEPTCGVDGGLQTAQVSQK